MKMLLGNLTGLVSVDLIHFRAFLTDDNEHVHGVIRQESGPGGIGPLQFLQRLPNIVNEMI